MPRSANAPSGTPAPCVAVRAGLSGAVGFTRRLKRDRRRVNVHRSAMPLRDLGDLNPRCRARPRTRARPRRPASRRRPRPRRALLAAGGAQAGRDAGFRLGLQIGWAMTSLGERDFGGAQVGASAMGHFAFLQFGGHRGPWRWTSERPVDRPASGGESPPVERRLPTPRRWRGRLRLERDPHRDDRADLHAAQRRGIRLAAGVARAA